MYILGLSCFRDDASAALLKDGSIVGIAEEERFIRIKHAVHVAPDVPFVTSLDESEPLDDLELRFFPIHSIEFLLKQAGINYEDLDYIAYDFDFDMRIERFHEFEPVSQLVSLEEQKRLIRCWRYWQQLLEDFARRCQAELLFVPHHLAHASGTVFSSGFKQTNFLIIDGLGELSGTTLGTFDGEIKILREVPLPHSLGLLYSAVTQFLGFRPFSGEQKTMGLAAYGEDRYRKQFEQIAWTTSQGYETNPDFIWTEDIKMHLLRPSALPQLFDMPPRDKQAHALNGAYRHVASSLQHHLERIVFHLINELNQLRPSDHLCLAGGVALNSQLNGKIAGRQDIKQLYIQPQAGDSGTALGAAYYQYFVLTGCCPEPAGHAYWGPGYNNGEVELTLKRLKLPRQRPSDLIEQVAKLLQDGKVVGWFQGRSECGPRALGNRSILANCAIKGMNDSINLHIKNRETWRPFAASILDEDRAEYLTLDLPSPYMLLTIPLTEQGQHQLAAASHINGTTRPQTVRQEINPKFHQLLTVFKERTGIGALLNTSFNVKSEPIVNSPVEAIQDFYMTGLDALVMDDFLLQKNG